MKIFFVVVLASWAIAQQSVDDAINTIFSNNTTFDDFLKNYDEVSPSPLKSLSALTKCGEGDQENRFVCVPYFNCDATTNTVRVDPDLDGTNKIDIRMGDDEHKCSHYMEICCQLAANASLSDNITIATPPTVTRIPTRATTAPITRPTPSGIPVIMRQPQRQDACGLRNSQGLDFNLVGRTNEALFGEFPWMVAILQNTSRGPDLAICGGSLITPRVVLTGAHCVKDANVNDFKVRVGEWDTQTTNERIPYQERNIRQKIVHKDYIQGSLYNNLALLILERPFAKADSVGTICLPKQNQQIFARECFATGWGKYVFGEEGRYAAILKKIQLPVVQRKQCQAALRRTRLGNSFVLHRSFICAGGEEGVDTCTGDGGSPLVCPDPTNPNRYVQAGIVSWGIGCGENQVPGVYADVAQFRNWVDVKLQELGISTVSYN